MTRVTLDCDKLPLFKTIKVLFISSNKIDRPFLSDGQLGFLPLFTEAENGPVPVGEVDLA